MEARDPLPSVRWARPPVFGVAPFDPGSVRKDADSATASHGTRRRGTTFRAPSGAPESGVRLTDWGQALCPALDALLTWVDLRPSTEAVPVRPIRGIPMRATDRASSGHPTD